MCSVAGCLPRPRQLSTSQRLTRAEREYWRQQDARRILSTGITVWPGEHDTVQLPCLIICRLYMAASWPEHPGVYCPFYNALIHKVHRGVTKLMITTESCATPTWLTPNLVQLTTKVLFHILLYMYILSFLCYLMH